jgi:hypothetical protein
LLSEQLQQASIDDLVESTLLPPVRFCQNPPSSRYTSLLLNPWHQKAFRHVWRLAEQLYAGSYSSVVMSTVGNAILNPALQGAAFDAVILDESTNISEPQVTATIYRVAHQLSKIVQIGDAAQLGPTVLAPTESELANQHGLSFFHRMELTGVPVQLLNT